MRVKETKQPKLSIHNMYLKSRQFNYLHILCKNKIHLNACLNYAASERYDLSAFQNINMLLIF